MVVVSVCTDKHFYTIVYLQNCNAAFITDSLYENGLEKASCMDIMKGIVKIWQLDAGMEYVEPSFHSFSSPLQGLGI